MRRKYFRINYFFVPDCLRISWNALPVQLNSLEKDLRLNGLRRRAWKNEQVGLPSMSTRLSMLYTVVLKIFSAHSYSGVLWQKACFSLCTPDLGIRFWLASEKTFLQEKIFPSRRWDSMKVSHFRHSSNMCLGKHFASASQLAILPSNCYINSKNKHCCKNN